MKKTERYKIIPIFILILGTFLTILFFWNNYGYFSYYSVIKNRGFYKYSTIDILTPVSKSSFEFLSPLKNTPLHNEYEKNFCCDNCECYPKHTISIWVDRDVDIYWILERQKGSKEDLLQWYGPYYSSYFNRYKEAHIYDEYPNLQIENNSAIEIARLRCENSGGKFKETRPDCIDCEPIFSCNCVQEYNTKNGNVTTSTSLISDNGTCRNCINDFECSQLFCYSSNNLCSSDDCNASRSCTETTRRCIRGKCVITSQEFGNSDSPKDHECIKNKCVSK